MRKQQNNHSNMKKRQGMYFSIIFVLISLGVLTGCAAEEKSESSTISINNGDYDETSSEIATEESKDPNMITPTETTPESTKAVPESNTDIEVSLSTDATEVKNISEKIFAAYFKGDWDIMNEYSLDSNNNMIDVYSDATKDIAIPECTIKGLSEINDVNIDENYDVSCEFLEYPEDDSYQYLTISFIKTSDGWKITFVGLEM